MVVLGRHLWWMCGLDLLSLWNFGAGPAYLCGEELAHELVGLVFPCGAVVVGMLSGAQS